MTRLPTQSQLIERLQRERAKLESLLAPLNDAQLKRRGVRDDYSVREIVAWRYKHMRAHGRHLRKWMGTLKHEGASERAH